MPPTFSSVGDFGGSHEPGLTLTVAGLPGSKAFDMGVGFLAVGFVGTCLSWILLLKVGRRRIYNTGLVTLAVLQFVIGIMDCAPNYSQHPGIIWAQSTLMV